MLRSLAAVALAATLSACAPPDSAAAPAPAARPGSAVEADPADGRVAVVELFTSEGCSSCPPADALLADLAGREDVVALSFHVDYWDDLGWRDPYSSALATARQRAYAQALDGRVYTPEMVVGGTVGFVGSRRAEAQTAITAALAAPSAVAVVAVEVAARHTGRSVEATYAAEGLAEGDVVHVALVQRAAESRPSRGENSGRTLRHAHVVRAFETQTGATGTATFALPDGIDATDVLVVAYAQHGAVGPIGGAARANVR